ncbi:hypothetical protein M8C21_019311, partial [Ambrosia artemisiifolia]
FHILAAAFFKNPLNFLWDVIAGIFSRRQPNEESIIEAPHYHKLKKLVAFALVGENHVNDGSSVSNMWCVIDSDASDY